MSRLRFGVKRFWAIGIDDRLSRAFLGDNESVHLDPKFLRSVMGPGHRGAGHRSRHNLPCLKRKG